LLTPLPSAGFGVITLSGYAQIQAVHRFSLYDPVVLDILESVGRFPVLPFGGEDLALGFALTLSGYHVLPIPVLENAETPETALGLWKQLAGWYLGTLGYFVFWRHLPSDSCRKRIRHVIAISLLGLLDSLKWLLKGPIIIAYFFLACLTNHLFAAIVLYLTYFYVPYGFLLRVWFRLPATLFPRIAFSKLAIVTALSWLVPIVRSGPPWLGLFWGLAF
jgi:hypothetical protein